MYVFENYLINFLDTQQHDTWLLGSVCVGTCQLTLGVFMYAPAAKVVHSFVEFALQVQYLFISISL